MSLKPLQIFSLIIVLISFLSSCTKLIQEEFPEIEKKPVVNAIIVTGDTIKVYVSLTDKLDKIGIDFIDNAEVYLYVNEELLDQLTYNSKGYYYSDIIAESNVEYKCEVFIPGYEKAECYSTLPNQLSIYDIEFLPNSFINREGRTFSQINFTFSNNPQYRSYYQVLVRKKEFPDRYFGSILGFENIEESIDKLLLNEGGIISGVFSNELINGNEYRMSLYCEVDPPFIMEFRTLSYDYYLFLKDLYNFEMYVNNIPLTGSSAPYPIHSNIINGQGIFSGYSVYITDTINIQIRTK